MLIAVTMAKLLFAMAVGIFVKRIGLVGQEGTKNMSGLVVNITSPLMIISSIASVNVTDKRLTLYALLIGTVMYTAVILLSRIIAKVFRFPDRYSALYQCAFIFQNCIFMGIPVASSFLGPESVFFITLLSMPFNILFFSYGVRILTGEKNKASKLNQFVNPGLIAGVVAMFLFFTGLRLPAPVNDTFVFIGSITTPLSMIVLGSMIGDFGLATIFKDKSAYGVSLVRLVVLPLLTWLILKNLVSDRFLVACAVILNAMPVASVVAMVAGTIEGMEKKTSVIVALTTILSMGTIPVIALVTGIV